MIAEDQLREALSQHLANALLAGLDGSQNALQVDAVERAGIDYDSALRMGLIYLDFIESRGIAVGRDYAAAMAFAAGVVVGRTARDAQVTADEARAA